MMLRRSSLAIGRGRIWFRMFGYGLMLVDTKGAPLVLYSERNRLGGHSLYLGRFIVRLLI
jgi:hypothetical protein